MKKTFKNIFRQFTDSPKLKRKEAIAIVRSDKTSALTGRKYGMREKPEGVSS